MVLLIEPIVPESALAEVEAESAAEAGAKIGPGKIVRIRQRPMGLCDCGEPPQPHTWKLHEQE